MFYYFHKALGIKKRQGLALPSLQLTTYETRFLLWCDRRALSPSPAVGGTDAIYTTVAGILFKKKLKKCK